MKTKNKLFSKFLLLIALIVLSSCEKDLYENQIQNTYKKRDITFKQFINETGLTNFDTSITIPPKPTDIQGRTADGKYELTDFDIDTDVIKSMEFQQKITYSLKVHPKDTISENFFNLIVYKKNNAWEKLIIEMKPSPENLNEIQNGLTDNFEGQMRKLYDSSPPPVMSACVEITITSYHCTGCFGECSCTRTCCVTTLTYNTCDFGSGTPGDSGGFGGNQSGNSGNSGSSGSGDGTWNNGTGGSTPSPDDIVIEPNLEPSSIAEVLEINRFNLFLKDLKISDLASYNYLNQHPTIKNQVLNYLIANNWSPNFKDFIKQMINLCATNNSTFTLDSSINTQNAQVFNNVNEFQNYLNNLNNLNNQLVSNVSISSNASDKKTSHGTFGLPMFCYINEHFNQNLKTQTQPWKLNSVTFDLSGLTLGTTWTQNEPDDPIVFIGDVAIIHIKGYIHLNAFVGGYGNFYTDEVDILIKINTITGEIVYGEITGINQ